MYSFSEIPDDYVIELIGDKLPEDELKLNFDGVRTIEEVIRLTK